MRRPMLLLFQLITSSLALMLSHHFFSLRFKLYKKAWEYASIGELLSILKVVTFSILVAAIVQQILVGEIFFRLLAVTWSLHMFINRRFPFLLEDCLGIHL